MWGEFIEKKKPGAKVAELTYNNDFGKAYATAMQKVAKEKGFTIVESKLHEGTATNLDNEIAAILAANPDVVLGETTGKFCPMLMAGLAAGGYKGITADLGHVRVGRVSSGSRSTRPATACTSSACRRTRAIRASPTTRP